MNNKKFAFSMLFLRASVFLVILMWTIDKFVNPEHAAKVYGKFYYLPGLENLAMIAIGTVEIIVLILFFIGYKKTYTYGAIIRYRHSHPLRYTSHPLRGQTYYSLPPGQC